MERFLDFLIGILALIEFVLVLLIFSAAKSYTEKNDCKIKKNQLATAVITRKISKFRNFPKEDIDNFKGANTNLISLEMWNRILLIALATIQFFK